MALKTVEALIKAGANVNARDKNGDIALMQAALKKKARLYFKPSRLLYSSYSCCAFSNSRSSSS